MKRIFNLTFYLVTVALLSCKTSSEDLPPEENQNPGVHILWDQSTLVQVSSEGFYPRMRVLENGAMLLVYENFNGDVIVKSSTDGLNWEELGSVYDSFDYNAPQNGGNVKVRVTNPEIIQLENGDILLAVNLRPTVDGVFPFSIAVKRSTDNGMTWGGPTILYEGGKSFDNGCWEPAFLRLPNGDLQLYFANETPYPNSHDQQISVLTSTDQGHTWSEDFLTASYRAGHRDGMPVPVHDGDHIYVSIEDNGFGQFKPYIIKNPIEGSWTTTVSGNAENRYSALASPLPNSAYAGAPYLIRTDEDIYLLSYQTTENRADNWELSTMEVVASESPVDFKNPSRPFNVPLSKEAKWNSLTDLGDGEIAALSTTNFNTDRVGIWMITGTIEIKR